MALYLQPRDLTEALRSMAEPGPRVIAGGTDLYPAVPGSIPRGPMVSIADLADLRGISNTPAGVRIGACTPWSEIRDAELPPAFDALQAAARTIGGRQIQNMGTLGGNLCNASPAADGVPPLLVLDATVELRSATGAHRLALSDFLSGARRTALGTGEILTAIEIPHTALNGRSVFLKLGARSHLVISIAMVAVRLDVRDGRVRSAALAVGACGPSARRLPEVEAALTGAVADDTLAERIRSGPVDAALAPIDDIRATAAYRREAALTLLRRGVGLLTARRA